MLRNAHVNDVEEMSRLINQFAKKDLMLPRPLSELYEKIRDYYVYIENGSIKGCASLHVFWKDLAEIKSVAVDKNFQKQGIGKEMLLQIANDVKIEGIKEIVLFPYDKTNAKTYYDALGFRKFNTRLIYIKTDQLINNLES